MPRPKPHTRSNAMDDQFAAFEADFPAMVREVVNSALDAKLSSQLDSCFSAYFEQFRRKLTHDLFLHVEGKGPSNPPLASHHDATELGPILQPPNPGIPNPRPSWQQRLEFPRFMAVEDLIAWIYKAEQFFSFYGIPDA